MYVAARQCLNHSTTSECRDCGGKVTESDLLWPMVQARKRGCLCRRL